jgi:hypothetical protein
MPSNFSGVTQPANENSCGAYCLAYVRALIQASVPTKGDVDGYYKQIQFCDCFDAKPFKGIAPDCGRYGDPIKMYWVIKAWFPSWPVTFYYAASSSIEGILKDLKTICPKYDQDSLAQVGLPALGAEKVEEFSILACTIIPAGGLHYVLFHKDPADGNIYRYNPWNGVGIQTPNPPPAQDNPTYDDILAGKSFSNKVVDWQGQTRYISLEYAGGGILINKNA